MSALWIWLGAGGLYAAFRLWYDNWRGPLRPDEIERFLAALRDTPGAALNDLDALRRFLESDDGREFVMLNLVRVAPGDVPHPKTGVPTPAARLLREYIAGFLPTLIRNGGHPALHARKVGPYVDAWNAAPDPGWSFVVIQDAWPGNVRIQGGVPNEDGGSAQWDPTTPPGVNYQCVDEVPSSDTDFVSTNTSDELDMYGMSALVETYPIESILGIQLSARAKLEGSATPKDLQMAILSGATYDYSANNQVQDDVYAWYNKVWSINPATSSPFTPEEINALKIGIKSKTRP